MFRFRISRAIGLIAAPTKTFIPLTATLPKNFSNKPQTKSRPLQVNNPLLKELELENKTLEDLVAQKSLSGFKVERRFESSLLGRSSPSSITLTRQDEKIRVTINLNETGYPEENQEEGHDHDHDLRQGVEDALLKDGEEQNQDKRDEAGEDFEEEGTSPVTQFHAKIEILDETGHASESLQLLGDLDSEQNDYAIHTIITNQLGTGIDVEALPEKLRDQIHKYFEQYGINQELVEIYDRVYSVGEEESADQHDITNLAALKDLSKFVSHLNAAKRK